MATGNRTCGEENRWQFRMRWAKWSGMKTGMIILFLAAATALASPVNPAAIRAAAAYSSSAGGTSFLALQNGQTLLEQSAGEPHKIYSGT